MVPTEKDRPITITRLDICEVMQPWVDLGCCSSVFADAVFDDLLSRDESR